MYKSGSFFGGENSENVHVDRQNHLFWPPFSLSYLESGCACVKRKVKMTWKCRPLQQQTEKMKQPLCDDFSQFMDNLRQIMEEMHWIIVNRGVFIHLVSS